MFDIQARKRWWLLMAILLAAGSANADSGAETLRPSFAELESGAGKASRARDKHYARIARLAVLAAALDVGATIKGRTDVVWIGQVSVTRGMRARRDPAQVVVERTTERTDTATGQTRTMVTRWSISARGLASIDVEQRPGRAAERRSGSGEPRARSLEPGEPRFERVRAGINRALQREGVRLR